MYCKKCGGHVYHDSLYQNETFVDLSCLMCGKRWHIPKSSPLGQRVLNAEKKKLHAV
jgi:hypothetical protein